MSFQSFGHGIWAVVKRFPFPVALSIISTVIGIVHIHVPKNDALFKSLIVLSLATTIAVSVALLAEALKWRKAPLWVANVVLILLGVGYFFLLPGLEAQNELPFVRHAMWEFAATFSVTFVAFAAHFGEGVIARFWEFARRLIVATIFTGIWGGAIFAGLSAALATTNFLFSLNIPEERFAELWIIVVGLFCTTFFLNRIPKEPNEIHTDFAYPKEVRLFSTFVLVPLVSIYFVILYLYDAKILLTGEWPEGQLAYIILGFTVVGLLTYLALYPLRSTVTWVRHFGMALCIAIIPQVFMLCWALWFRVSEYGLTENRYLVYVYGAWLLGVSLYLLVSKVKDIRIVPVSLFVLAILCSFGPWGAFSVAAQSQMNRLERILERNERLVAGKYVSSDQIISGDDLYEMTQILRFLERRDGLHRVDSLFDEPMDLSDLGRWTQARAVMENSFGLEYRTQRDQGSGVLSDRQEFSIDLRNRESIALTTDGHPYVFQVFSSDTFNTAIGPQSISGILNSEDQRIDLTLDGKPLGYIPLASLIEKELQDHDSHFPTLDDVSIVVSTDQFDAKAVITSLRGYVENDEVHLRYLKATIFLTLK